ncbi:uncharacterized protein BKCO1_4900023 [Diplodia corticola]|uniref:Pentatricopeptide repeat domain-containing protein n=1 Tax=Diplodia corticola TaxID=236234 RepID=A0A1J9RSD5_9PEZI|nr:uncharacterized protein BKCO1_4900023 [Diplodia corticola]OJD31351.1 hypothetical protein BKCO1_4900023 [Diplodia corticola]
MRIALDRLLARSSILRVHRLLKTEEELPSASVSRAHCRLHPTKASIGQQRVAGRAFTSSRVRTEEEPHGSGAVSGTNAISHTSSSAISGEGTKDAVNISPDKWIESLQFRQRLYGSDGVQAVWKELRQSDVDLPTTGRSARSLWGTFLADKQLLPEVVAYAEDLRERTNAFYRPLYETVIGRCFHENRSQDVQRWHHKLYQAFPPREGSMRLFASKADSNAYVEAFCYIYARHHERNVYDVLIPRLCSRNLWRRALRCHKWLIKMKDFPAGTSTASSVELTFQELLLANGQRHNAKHNTVADTRDHNMSFSRETMNMVLGEVHGIPPKQMDDHFCARIFATKAFSIDVIIRGLGMFGIDEVGPLALREMASRTVDPEQISHHIQTLNEAGISIGRSVYSQALQKFAHSNRQDLIMSLITTDQHPDAFEDHGLQRKLLSTFVERGSWDEVHRTLAILTIFHRDPVREQWNVLVQKLASLRLLQMLCKVLEDMLAQGVSLTEASLSALQVYQLRPRTSSKAPVPGALDYDDTTLIGNILRSTLVAGGAVGPRRWIEIFKRYGMTERFDDVVKLALWLADWYSLDKIHASPGTLQSILQRKQQALQPIIDRALPPTNPLHPLRQIFTNQQLRAFVAWGIRRALILPSPVDPEKSKKPPHYWAQGLRLCMALRKRGVHVSSRVVTAELRLQLSHLFGHYESVRGHNRRSAANVPYSLLEMVEFANQMWAEGAGKPLMDPRELTKGPSHHFGFWWAKRLRWDVLRQAQAALREEESSNSTGYDKIDMAAMQGSEKDFVSSGIWEDMEATDFRQTQDASHEIMSTPDQDRLRSTSTFEGPSETSLSEPVHKKKT